MDYRMIRKMLRDGLRVDSIDDEKTPENYQEYDARYEELLSLLVDDGFEHRAVS